MFKIEWLGKTEERCSVNGDIRSTPVWIHLTGPDMPKDWVFPSYESAREYLAERWRKWPDLTEYENFDMMRIVPVEAEYVI